MFTPPQTCHVSCVTCHVSLITCHMSCVTFFFLAKWWSLSVEGLFSTGPTPSSFFSVPDYWGLQGHRLEPWQWGRRHPEQVRGAPAGGGQGPRRHHHRHHSYTHICSARIPAIIVNHILLKVRASIITIKTRDTARIWRKVRKMGKVGSICNTKKDFCEGEERKQREALLLKGPSTIYFFSLKD